MSDNQTRMAGMIFNERPDYTGLGTMGQKGRSFLKNSAVMNEAGIKAGGLKGIGQAHEAKLMADAKISAANAQADATRSNGMWSMIGSIGGGVLGGIGKMSGPANTTDSPLINKQQDILPSDPIWGDAFGY